MRLATASLAVLLAGCSTSAAGWTPVIPASLAVPSTQVLSLRARAIGVQTYECRRTAADPSRAEWILTDSEADLFDRAGEKIGRQRGRATWDASDGSTVSGEVTARHEAPEPNAIPWLLLRAKSTSGSGVLRGIQSVQQVDTAGGTAPAGGCDEARVGATARVSYRASYYFYEARP